MSAWSDHVAAPFRREYGSLCVVSDPDEILLAPSVSQILVSRGFELLPYRDPLTFRLLFESEILADAGGRGFIVHVRGDAREMVPWDVLQRARVESLSIAELFGGLDSSAVRSIGSTRYDDLWQVFSSCMGMPAMGTVATKDFLTANVYRVVPGLMRHPHDLWIEAFDLFFRGESLPLLLAAHVADRACRPEGMTVAEAALILSDRATFLDRTQGDWDRYVEAVAHGVAPADDIIPFSIPRIRTSLDSMVLDGTIAPTKIDHIPDEIPSWMRIGMVRDAVAVRALAELRIDQLAADVPGDDATHRTWLRFAERHAEIIDGWEALPTADMAAPNGMAKLATTIDTAFFSWLERGYDALSSNSYASAPSIVHQIAPHMAHRRRMGNTRQALVVMDGLALDQWLTIERRLRAQRPDVLIDTRSCFAWLPTATGVSRQAIFAGDQPRAFAKTLGGTSAEPGAWRRFWATEGVPDQQIFYAKGLGRPGSSTAVIGGPIADNVEIIGIVVNTVDELLHGETFGKRSLTSRIEQWLGFGEWDRLISALIDAGYQIVVTADHGNVEVVGMGRPSEGSTAEEHSERVRIYDSEALRQKSSKTIAGARILQPGGLPDAYKPLFAPFGRAFIPDGRHAVVHGGTSIEEVIVPFVRISKRDKA